MAVRGTGQAVVTRGIPTSSGVGVATGMQDFVTAAPGTILLAGITAVNFRAVSGLPQVMPDNGGERFVLSGVFPKNVDIVVSVDDLAGTVRECYGSALLDRAQGLSTVGRKYVCRSTDGTSLVAVMPPMPIGTGYTVKAQVVGGSSDSLVGALDVVKRSYWTTTYELRKDFAAGIYAVGPTDIHGETI